jgi:hypothetical protein
MQPLFTDHLKSDWKRNRTGSKRTQIEMKLEANLSTVTDSH